MLSDRVAYHCSRCSHVTYAPPGHVAVTCTHCGRIDLGTELARQRWRTVAEIHLANAPDPHPQQEGVSLRVLSAWAIAAAVVCALVFLVIVAVTL